MERLSWPVVFESVVSLMCTSFFHLAFLQCINSWLTLLRLFMVWFVLAARPPSACAQRGASVPLSCVVRSFSSFLHPPASQHPDAVHSPVKQSYGLCTHPTANTPRIPSRPAFFNIATKSLALDTCGSPPTHQQIQVTSRAHALSKR